MRDKVGAGDMEPGMIMVGGRIFPLWDMPYARMVEEFKSMGAERVERKAS